MSHSDIVFNGSVDPHGTYAVDDETECCDKEELKNAQLLKDLGPDDKMVFSFGHERGETRVRVVLTRRELKRWIKFLKGSKKCMDFNREIAEVSNVEE